MGDEWDKWEIARSQTWQWKKNIGMDDFLSYKTSILLKSLWILRHRAVSPASSLLTGPQVGQEMRLSETVESLCMEEILHHLVDALSHCNPIIYNASELSNQLVHPQYIICNNNHSILQYTYIHTLITYIHIYIITYIWVNYNISLTWIKAHLGMISLTNHDSSEVAVRSL